MKKFWMLFLLFPAVCIITSCGASPTTPDDSSISNSSFVLSKNAISTTNYRVKIIKQTGDSNAITLKDTVGTGIKPGSIIWSDSTDINQLSPYLKEVYEVKDTNGVFVLKTKDASIEDIIDSGTIQIASQKLNLNKLEVLDSSFSVDSTTPSSGKQAVARAHLRNGVAARDASGSYTFKFNGLKMKNNSASLTLDGAITVNAEINNIRLNYDKGLKDANFDITMTYTVNATISTTGSYSASAEKPIATLKFARIPLGVSGLFLEPQFLLQLSSNTELNAKQSISASVTESENHKINYNSTTGWGKTSSNDLTGAITKYDFSSGIKGTAFAGLSGDLRLMVNGILGPDLSGVGGLEGDYVSKIHQDTLTTTLTLSALASAAFGGKFDIFGKETSFANIQLLDKRLPLYTTSLDSLLNDCFDTTISGNGSIHGQEIGTHDYVLHNLDLSRYPNGGNLTISIKTGSGASSLSFDLFANTASIQSTGRQQSSLATAYDISPNSNITMNYKFPAGTQMVILGAEGNWFSDPSLTNSYSFSATVECNK